MSDTNNALIRNIQDQLERLMTQLEDLNEEKSSMSPEEYEEAREDSIEQLKDLERTLSKIEQGDISAIDELTSTKMAIRAAIGEAFRTPEIVALFARKQPAALRQKLLSAEADRKLGTISETVYIAKKSEILTALQKLKEPLTTEELTFLQSQEPIFSYNLTEASSNRVASDNIIKQVS